MTPDEVLAALRQKGHEARISSVDSIGRFLVHVGDRVLHFAEAERVARGWATLEEVARQRSAEAEGEKGDDR